MTIQHGRFDETASGSRSCSAFELVEISPQEADPAVQAFLAPNLIALPRVPRPDVRPIVFLPGADRIPSDELTLIEFLARQGCRVIGLTYNNAPSIRSTCPEEPDPHCSAKLREMRVFGTGGATDTVPPSETIASRLAAVIGALDRRRPADDWNTLLGWTEPAWHRLIVGGHSQGGGMAAFIAKKRNVGRVALFSNPADFRLVGQSSTPELVPWISDAGVTPAERQFAIYHAREEAARLVAASLHAMRLPEGNVRALDLDLPPEAAAAGTTYHQIVTRDRRYEAAWSWLFGLYGQPGDGEGRDADR